MNYTNSTFLNVAMIFLAAAVIGFSLPSPARSAEISVGAGQCEFQLTGEILKDDAAAITAFLAARERIKSDRNKDGQITLCLDSPGGDFNEAMQIIDILKSHDGDYFQGISTLVPKGATCASACGFIFLAGNYSESPGELPRMPSRDIELGSDSIGFHQPSFSVKPGKYDAALLEEAGRVQLTNIKKLMQRNEEQFFPNSLLIEALTVGPHDLFKISTIDNLGRWDIGLRGHHPDMTVTPQMALQGCLNKSQWRIGQSNSSLADMSQQPNGQPDRTSVTANGITFYRFDGYGAEGTEHCTVILRGGDNPGVLIDFAEERGAKDALLPITEKDLASAKERLDFPRDLRDDFWMLLPPSTTISSLSSSATGTVVIQETTSRMLGDSSAEAESAVSSEGEDQAEPSDEPSAVTFKVFRNADTDGSLMSKVPGNSIKVCQEACADFAGCRGFTFNEWNSLCFLKSSSEVRYFEPSSHSGILVSELDPAPSGNEIVVQRFRNRIFPGKPAFKAKANSEVSCRDQCVDQGQCVAYSFIKNKRLCQMYRHAGEYMPNKNADSGVQRQVR